ncbi:flagellar motor protein MotB [Stutzerimonas decontaminans]|uniref:Flagellar motor protein MotB n=2 Tax=Stutzerimonas TaxID=2901164 RepID=A0ABX4W5N2_9GAMM|nr:OmpA family protein [Stutzerimonas decontaminans]AHY42517.1 flagellar motor protein MotB [Stutzerimonas decontaminans]MCQ4246347.1 OmpA family protein [Stutzerimonas decontaminans]PNF86801.1 flagellar motor protein MotB [Stutzerimonas decontaminans]
MNGPTSQGSRFSKWHIEPQREEEQEAWLVTYLDMLTLLLVMLVIMLAMAGKGDGKQIEQAQLASTALQIADGPSASPDLSATPIPLIAALPTPPIEAEPSGADVPETLSDMALGDDIEVIVNEGSISFRISSEILFGSGRAELEDAGLDVIDRLVPTLAASRYRIIVEGHTDNLPIQTERFPSNWELSASRASSVVRYLQLAGIEATRLSATGYADTRPIADNREDRGRASNRRVELIMQTEPDKP